MTLGKPMRRFANKVLIAGCERPLFDWLQNLLSEVEEGREFELRLAESLDGAVNEVTREGYDFCLVDESLGAAGTAGLAAASQDRYLPIILLASEAAALDVAEVLKAGACDFLVKEQLTATALIRSLRYACEQTRAQEALRESEQRFGDLVENASDIIYTHDLAGKFLSLNRAGEILTGYSREEALAMNIADVVAPEYLDVVRTMSERRLADGAPVVYELEIITKDGGRMALEVNTRTIFHRNEPAYIQGVARNLTKRRRAEEALRDSEERIRVIMETASDAIITIDENSTILFANPAAGKSFGYSVAELTGAKITMLMPDYLRQAHLAGLQRNIETGERSISWEAYEVPGLHRSGHEIPLEISIGDYERHGKRFYTSVIRDISERKRAREAIKRSEEQLLQSQKLEAIGRLAGGVAHDFNNLLTAITGYSDLSLRRLAAEDPVRRSIEEIKRAAARAADLTKQLLAFSRKQVLQLSVLDLNAVVTEVEKMLRRLIGEDIVLSVNLGKDVGLVKADPGQLEQVILNLAINARDAMPGGGGLTIETANARLDEAYASRDVGVTPGDYVVLAISDTGHGMDAETRRRIFEPFFTTKDKGKGTGLGLSTVYGIVKQSGGSVWVDSEPGLGSTFKVYLPIVADKAEQSKPTRRDDEMPRGSETILLVEDDQGVREMTREILEMCGYQVLVARRGGEAVRICEAYEGKIHLLLTDVVMPHLSGKELATALTLLRPGMKVLFMSGYTDDAIVKHGVLGDAVDFLQKPFTPGALAHKLREVLTTGARAR